MSPAENKALYRRYIELLWRPEELGEVLTPGFVAHDLPPGLPPGPEGLKAFRRLVERAFPDLKPIIRDIVAEGDKVAARVGLEGTHAGDFMGVAPTGKSLASELFEIVRIEGGKIAERWVLRDRLGEFQQLGVLPAKLP
jgi:predicted ester cyclase